MDANRQRFWMLADRYDWSGPATQWNRVEYDAACRSLRLRDSRPARSLLRALNTSGTNALLGTPSLAIDRYGSIAFWNPVDRAVQVTDGTGPGARTIPLWSAPSGYRVRDLAMGFDDVLYIAVEEVDAGGEVVRSFAGLFDPRGRWRRPPVFEVPLDAFSAHSLAADPEGGVWLLDRDRRAIGRVRGLPLRDGLPPPFAPTTFRPRPENEDAPHFAVASRQPEWETGERPIALACSQAGRLALIAWRASNETWLHVRDETGSWEPARRLADPGEGHPNFEPSRRARPATLAWLSDRRLVVLPGPRMGAEPMPREAVPYDPDDRTTEIRPGGGFYPVRALGSPQFLKGVTAPPHYPLAGSGRSSRALRPLSVVHYERGGMAASRRLDGGRDGTVWHRMYLEAVLPPGCGMRAELAATDEPDAGDAELEWHAHLFGDVRSGDEDDGDGGEEDGGEEDGGGEEVSDEDIGGEVDDGEEEDALVPAYSTPARGVWLKDRSEIPHHSGFLDRVPEPDRVGLFTVLVQRPARRVRRLEGRYLHLRLHLQGTGHLTPQVAALRVYASRFSYRDEYLPELYGEMLFGEDAARHGPATGPDFLERFIALFESVLTPLEDRATTAQPVMSPGSTPPEALDWLASWLGIVFDKSFPEDRRRAWLEAAPRLFRTRGTLAGLKLALEIATGGRLRRELVDRRDVETRGLTVVRAADSTGEADLREMEIPVGGGVTGGEIVVVEDYRLRRTLSTILGADLSEEADPLLPGLIVSANSRVGDTLFVGDAEREELLALFRDAFSEGGERRRTELESVRDLYDRVSHRATVFVHDAVVPANFGLLERIAVREAPAHVQVRVVRATYPLLVGLSSLVDLDTYLGPRPPRRYARVDESRIGEGDFVRDDPALFPDMGFGGAVTAPPEARISGPELARSGATVTLDGSPSTAAPGRLIDRYVWMLTPPS